MERVECPPTCMMSKFAGKLVLPVKIVFRPPGCMYIYIYVYREHTHTHIYIYIDIHFYMCNI